VTANAAFVGLANEQIRFFDHHVRGVANGIDDDHPVKLFIMGANEWRDGADWPLPDTEFTPYICTAKVAPGSDLGDRELRFESPSHQPQDVYLYDSRDPVPTLGQTFLPGFLVGGADAGPRDQSPVESPRRPLLHIRPVGGGRRSHRPSQPHALRSVVGSGHRLHCQTRGRPTPTEAERIAGAAVDHGKAAAIHLPGSEWAAEVRSIGFSFLSCSFESQLLRVASERTAGALRAS
jgi:hypothetical protein